LVGFRTLHLAGLVAGLAGHSGIGAGVNMFGSLVPSDISQMGSGLTAKALPVRAASSSVENCPTCGKVFGMQPNVSRTALETRMMSP
jgi:hypothetical protein